MRFPPLSIAVAGLASALSACAPTDGFYSGRDHQTHCDPEPAVALEAVDWDDAESIDVRIRQGEYWPLVLTLQQHRPYVLSITNADAESRLFNAKRLFQKADLGPVSVAGGPPKYDPVDGLDLPPAATAEIHLRALCTGRYDVLDTWWPQISVAAYGGVIYVE